MPTNLLEEEIREFQGRVWAVLEIEIVRKYKM